MLKKRITEAFAIACCGCLLLSFAVTNQNLSNNNNNFSLLAGSSAATSVDVASLSDLSKDSANLDETAVSWIDFGYETLGVSSAEGNLNVRKEADENSTIIGKLPENGGCNIVEQVDNWYHITSGDVEGYVSADFILTGDEAYNRAVSVATDIATVTGDALRVREEMSTESDIIALMPKGEEVEVVANLGDWIQVDVDNETGYISGDYVTIETKIPCALTMAQIRYGNGVSQTRSDLCAYACQFIGNPYVWGGVSLTNGADCSGFVLSIYKKWGISLPHSSRAQANYGTRIKASEAKPGDLFFYGSGKSISHVAIYIGNGQIVHASSRKTGIKISNAYYRNPICVVRLLSD